MKFGGYVFLRDVILFLTESFRSMALLGVPLTDFGLIRISELAVILENHSNLRTADIHDFLSAAFKIGAESILECQFAMEAISIILDFL